MALTVLQVLQLKLVFVKCLCIFFFSPDMPLALLASFSFLMFTLGFNPLVFPVTGWCITKQWVGNVCLDRASECFYGGLFNLFNQKVFTFTLC